MYVCVWRAIVFAADLRKRGEKAEREAAGADLVPPEGGEIHEEVIEEMQVEVEEGADGAGAGAEGGSAADGSSGGGGGGAKAAGAEEAADGGEGEEEGSGGRGGRGGHSGVNGRPATRTQTTVRTVVR